jgi:O-antigen/teichoic acid export membrane protein
MFFISQMVVAITFSADNLIIARTLGAAAVAQFSIPQRMFSVVGVIATVLITPLWPAYGEAISRGDMIWVRHTLVRSLLGILLLTAFTSVALVLLSSRILLLWVGPSIRPSLFLLSGLAVWAAMQSVTGTLQAFLNGGSILRFVAAVHCVFGVVCLPAKIWLAARYGIASLPWATVVCYGLIVALPTSLYVVRLVEGMTAGSHTTAK